MRISFKRDTSFRKQFFVPDSFAHPAKMDAQLLLWIVEHYTEAGETILDPMAGMGTTMLACILGRDVVLVELEEKFCKMMRDNWEQVKMRPQLGSTMGTCQIIQGDARDLRNVLFDDPYGLPPEATEKFDKIVTSPPFAESVHHTDDPKYSEKYRPGRSHHLAGTAGDSEGNIGQLPYGQIDKIVTSPPYEAAVSASTGGERDMSSARQREKRLRDKGYDPKMYQGGVGRNLEVDFQYTKDKDNIGNLKSDSYLEAMLQVYQQCHKVLKPQGLMILVTKNFIRNKQVVRLDTDTIKLCEQAGFSFIERHERELPAQSFWRIIYKKKFPDVELIKSEGVLVFRK